jgi:hypothetical protein
MRTTTFLAPVRRSRQQAMTCLIYAAALFATLGTQALADEPQRGLPPLMSESEEIETALEGAPPHLRADAGVYVLKKIGYVRARETRNGFNCLLVREWAKTFEPTCFDSEGSATILPVILFRYDLLAKGASFDELDAAVGEGYRTGKFRAPRRVGVAYMLSTRNTVVLDSKTRKVGGAPPHLMFYSPYLTSADFGATEHESGSHFLISEEGTPTAMIIVPVHLDREHHHE